MKRHRDKYRSYKVDAEKIANAHGRSPSKMKGLFYAVRFHARLDVPYAELGITAKTSQGSCAISQSVLGYRHWDGTAFREATSCLLCAWDLRLIAIGRLASYTYLGLSTSLGAPTFRSAMESDGINVHIGNLARLPHQKCVCVHLLDRQLDHVLTVSCRRPNLSGAHMYCNVASHLAATQLGQGLTKQLKDGE